MKYWKLSLSIIFSISANAPAGMASGDGSHLNTGTTPVFSMAGPQGPPLVLRPAEILCKYLVSVDRGADAKRGHCDLWKICERSTLVSCESLWRDLLRSDLVKMRTLQVRVNYVGYSSIGVYIRARINYPHFAFFRPTPSWLPPGRSINYPHFAWLAWSYFKSDKAKFF